MCCLMSKSFVEQEKNQCIRVILLHNEVLKMLLYLQEEITLFLDAVSLWHALT